MNKRPLGRSGLDIAPLVFGGNVFGWTADEATSFKLLDRFVERGLKTPYRDGTTQVIFEPLDFIARLAALVPPPRLNLTRFHGVVAPNSPNRARITPARRGRCGKPKRPQPSEDRTPAEQRSAMRWAQRLKRVFQIDVESCPKCGGAVKVIACIEDPPVIERI